MPGAAVLTLAPGCRPVATLCCVDERVGFAGIGVMGRPMAEHLARAGVPLVVWNRTADKTAPLVELGAEVAADLDELFGRTRIVLLMLADFSAVDAVLDRHGDRFAARVGGHTIVPMGTTDADFSTKLARDVVAVGGRYVEGTGVRLPGAGRGRPAGGDARR